MRTVFWFELTSLDGYHESNRNLLLASEPSSEAD
jgi:hypothetical protein